mgnify:CR=1 FL=1
MRTLKPKTTIALALIGMFFTAASARADYGIPEVAPQDKIDVCIETIGTHANYDDATYVRHEVASKARATIGHTLKISTLVYDETDGQLIREYRTLCAVSKRPEPVAFRIRETK